MPALLSRFAKNLLVDRSLLYALTTRIWQAMAGPVTMVFLIHALHPDEQGVYSLLSNLMTIQVFFELGLLNVLISQAGHQFSDIQTARDDEQLTRAKNRMGQLLASSLKWFSFAGILYASVAIVLGWQMLASKLVLTEYWLPLIGLSISAAVTVALSPLMAILEGAGFRDSVYRMRFAQMISGAIVVWVSLSLDFKMWTLVFSSCVQLACVVLLTRVIHRRELDGFRSYAKREPIPDGLSWAKEVFPLQWRVAVVSVAHHIATQLFPLIIFWFHSERECGQLGMTLTGTAAIQGMALAWIQTKYSVVSTMHGAGDRESAGTLWQRLAFVSTALLLAGFVCAIAAIGLLPLAGRGWENRFLSPWQILVLGIGCLANHGVALQMFYVLSRKGRPFLLASLVSYFLTGLAVVLGGYWYSNSGIVCAYAITTCFVTLPLHTYFYWEYRKRVSPH